MRKVKFCQDAFDEKLGAILTEFPILDVRCRPAMRYACRLLTTASCRTSIPSFPLS